MTNRIVTIERTTKETAITCTLNLDGSGQVRTDTGIGFFDHMLSAFGRHGFFDIDIACKGDLQVDGHHTVEDCGIVLGQAFAQALGDKRGIARFADRTIPMDEALVMASVDISGRGACFWLLEVPQQMLGDFDSDLAHEFFIAFAANAGVTLHLVEIAGENAHHTLEATFKAAGRALGEAAALDPRVGDAVPSTKGAL